MPEPISFLRTSIAVGLKAGSKAVDRDNKVIRGYAVNTLGEWLGHDAWGDSDFIDSVVAMGNALPNGLKSRFTHPGLCADGMGKYLGRTKNFYRDGDVVRGDLHLGGAAEKSPNGDLADYVMTLAEDDPEAFGASIVLARDLGAEQDFSKRNLNTGGKFTTPDARNKRNLPHARLAQLRASDVVDDPASNPGGFLSSGQELAAVGERAFEYLTGLRESVPAETFGGIEAPRAKEFFESFLQRHGMSLNVSGTDSGGKETVMTEAEKAAANAEFRATETQRVASLRAAFPKHPDFVVSQIECGASLEAAKVAFKDVELAEAKAATAAANAQLEELKKAPRHQAKVPPKKGPAPQEFDGEDPAADLDAGNDFMALAREYASEKKVTLGAAVIVCQKLHANEHAEFVASQRAGKPRQIERKPSK